VERSEPVAHAALVRAARLTSLTPQHSEALQVVHYDVSQQYRCVPELLYIDGWGGIWTDGTSRNTEHTNDGDTPTPRPSCREHWDYFDPKAHGYAERMGRQGQRLVTVFVYLSDVVGGGCTHFPRLNLRSKPSKGCALLWYNLDGMGAPDELTLHAGEPVTQGQKWGMNIWLRERPGRLGGGLEAV